MLKPHELEMLRTVAKGVSAEFGSGSRNARGMFTGDKEWIMNHRFICMTKFNF